MKFKDAPKDGRVYKLGKYLNEGQKVWFRSRGKHYDMLGIVKFDERFNKKVVIVLPYEGCPKELYGMPWGLWEGHKYLLDNSQNV